MPSAALAGGSTFETEGVTIRLVAESPDASGRMRGALLFDLEPGWKTYWVDPGAAGLTPMLDFGASENVAAPTLAFPAPGRFSEGGIEFNGYDEPMAIAFDTVADAGTPRLAVKLFVGICRDICVPVSAELEIGPGIAPSAADASAIDRAFLALPGKGDGAIGAHEQGGELILTGLPAGRTHEDLFVSGPAGWAFGRSRRDGSTWRVPVRSRPKADPKSTLQAILVEGDGARSFVIDIR